MGFRHRSSGSSGGPSTSTGDTSYGSPRLLAGMVGDGIEEPYRLVLVEPVEEPEVVVREEPVMPVIVRVKQPLDLLVFRG